MDKPFRNQHETILRLFCIRHFRVWLTILPRNTAESQSNRRKNHTLNHHLSNPVLNKNFKTYHLCNPFKYELRCASFCGVEFAFKREIREKRAQRRSYLKGLQRLQGWTWKKETGRPCPILYRLYFFISYKTRLRFRRFSRTHPAWLRA